MAACKTAPLVVHIIYALKAGGLENGLVNIINRTPENRYRHAIICLTDADEFALRITSPDVQVMQLHKKPGNDFGIYWRLWKLLYELKPAIVHTRNLTSLEMQFVALWGIGAKRVHGEHGRDINDLDGRNRKYNTLRKLMRCFIHQYISVSKDLEQWLHQVVKVRTDKVTQIYNGVDLARFSEPGEDAKSDLPAGTPKGFCDNTLVVGTVGRLAEVKNQRSLLRAFAICLRWSPELSDRLRLLLVGDGPVKESLQKEATKLGIDRSVWFAGDRNDVPDLMRLMDVFTLPSLGEGISNTILEAMATGLPIVATEVGGNPELVTSGENGLLVPVDDDEALAFAIAKLVRDRPLRQQMSEKSLERVKERFNWDSTVERYLGVYDKLLTTNKEKTCAA